MEDEDLRRATAAADKAAQEGRGWDATGLLFIPPVIARMKARMRSQWGWITDEQMNDAIQESFVALYQEIRKGGKVRNSVAWLSNVAYRQAADAMRKTRSEDFFDPDEIESGGGPTQADPEATAAAFACFESLVARLTPDGIKRVMEIVVEAARTGVVVLTNTTIAEILGENPENVKKWRQRGFEKLGRLARDEGFVGDDFRLTDLIFDDGNEEMDQ